MKEILVSRGFADHMGGTVRELFQKDISGTGFTVALVKFGDPVPAAGDTAWVAPDVNVQGAAVSERVIKLFVDAMPAAGPGGYQLFVNVHDAPERVPLPLDKARLA